MNCKQVEKIEREVTMIKQLITNYVQNAVHPVTGDEIVNMVVANGYVASQAAGGTGTAVRDGCIRVIDTIYINGRKVNIFE